MSSLESSPSPSSVNSNNEFIGSSALPTTPPTLTPIRPDQKTSDPIVQPSTPKPTAQPTSFSEWQLLAVLQRANLVQYYDTFITQGGDDINQIMQCDEQEFLEIMSLVGMLSKPLHVRRLQRALSEFSKDQAAFNMQSIQHIGPPPPPPQFPLMNSNDAISYLMPTFAATLNSLASSSSPGLSNSEPSTTTFTTSTSASATTSTANNNNNNISGNVANNSVALATSVSSSMLNPLALTGTIGGTANIFCGERLRNLPSSISASFKEEERSTSPVSIAGDFLSLNESDTQSEIPVLSDAQIRRITICAENVFHSLPVFEPKLIQNKKRISREVLDLMAMPANTPGRLEEYRKYSAIYGRFDAKRKPNKVLSIHEVSVNEAAAQLCLLMPALLTRRDELFPLARQVIKNAGYQYQKSLKRRINEFSSPEINPASSPFSLDQDDFLPTNMEDKKSPQIEKSGYLERWASTKLNMTCSSDDQMTSDVTTTTSDYFQGFRNRLTS
ncbi:unnamed protein product [Auanema sp. JU1783]|nr:unnamed protein product [Auanema sp. JU1783]